MSTKQTTQKTWFEIRARSTADDLGLLTLYNAFESRKLARQWLNCKPAHKRDCRIYKVRTKERFKENRFFKSLEAQNANN